MFGDQGSVPAEDGAAKLTSVADQLADKLLAKIYGIGTGSLLVK